MKPTDDREPEDRKLRHWADLCRTDPVHTKRFERAGGFKGTAIRPIWNHYRLTEHFGPCGIGWGFARPEYQVVPGTDEVLVYCTLLCWYMDDNGERAEIYGVGGDKVTAKQQRGPFNDDEAFKKALTDAIGNAFLRVGLSADVHMGLFEDSKYVQETRRHFAQAPEDAEPSGDPGTQGSAGGARSAPQRQQAALAPSAAKSEADKRFREIKDSIDRCVGIPELESWIDSLPWRDCRDWIVQAKREEGMVLVQAIATANAAMEQLRMRIERRKALLADQAGLKDYEVG